MNRLYATVAFVLTVLLSACGGGSDGDGSEEIDNTDTNSLSISGTISPKDSIVLDSDLNDVFADFKSNNDPADPQVLDSNIVTIQGFASDEGTEAKASGNANSEQFAQVSDKNDYFEVFLQKGQIIRLQVIDFTSDNKDAVYSGDLDLYLLSNNQEDVAVSNGTTDIEQIVVPENGTYLINVFAFSGISKYVLELKVATPSLSSTASLSSSFATDEAIVFWKNEGKVRANSLIEIEGFQVTPKYNNEYPVRTKFHSIRSLSSTKNIAEDFPYNLEKKRTLQAIKRLNQRNDVYIAEPNYYRYAKATPNDPGFNDQFHYETIDLPDAWDTTQGSSEVVVAIIDSGILVSHPDFDEKLVDGFDFISDIENSADGDGIDSNPDDPGNPDNLSESDFHGTHVAGTVGARTDNEEGVSGVGWDTNLMPLRVLGPDGTGSNADIFEAIRYAAGMNNDSGTLPSKAADIINLSLGGGGRSQIEQDLYNEVRERGIFVVAAAGNEETDELSFPAAYEGVISVSASDPQDDLAFYSNFGSTIDVAAPGGELKRKPNGELIDGILSTYVDTESGVREPAYALLHGTSMASPHVAGVIALMKAVYPELTPDEFDALLESGTITDDLGTAGRDDQFGHGRINAAKAVSQAKNLADGGELPSSNQPILVATPQTIVLQDKTSETFDLNNINTAVDDPSVTHEISADWITLDTSNLDANGLGEYIVNVDDTAFDQGSYSGLIRFTPSEGNPLDVNVVMVINSTDTASDIAPTYVLLINSETEEVAAQAIVNSNGNYSLTGLSSGSYFLTAGSDIDVDTFICQAGETCGDYPEDEPAQEITLTNNSRTNVNFSVELIETSTLASKSSTKTLKISK